MIAPLIIGESDDAHVAVVIRRIRQLGAPEPVLIDAPTLGVGPFELNEDHLILGDVQVDLAGGGRGWLRRYAPTLWGAGLVAGSLEAARKRSFLALVGSISRRGQRQWLTSLDRLLRAEDRLLQLQVASDAGFAVPRTVVTSDGDRARATLGDRFVVKPLTAGYFHTSSGPRAVFTSLVTAAELDHIDFADAPFAAQEHVVARQHLRIVTVGERAWVGAIDADGRPLDWREQEEAHSAWRPITDAQAARSALDVAKAFGVGYSSQDWIRDVDGRLVFLDLNPGGQWLFLPPEIAEPVTTAIAAFLAGVDR